MRSSLVALAICLPASVLLVAFTGCVGDDPEGSASGSTSSGALPEAGASSSGATSTSSGATSSSSGGTSGCKVDGDCDAPTGGTATCNGGTCEKKCPTSFTLCGDTCIDTATTKEHCGKCDHSCGAGACTSSACQPFAAATGFTEVVAIDTSSTGLVIAADNSIKRCDLPDGCTTANLKAVVSGQSFLKDVAVAGTDVYFYVAGSDPEYIYKCPVAGCPGGTPELMNEVINDPVGRIAIGPNHVVWSRNDGSGGPYTQFCSRSDCKSTVAILRPTVGTWSSDPGRECLAPSCAYPLPYVTMSVGATRTLYASSIYNDGTTYLRSCPLSAPCSPVKVDTDNKYVFALFYFNGVHYGASSGTQGNHLIFGINDATAARTPLVSDAAGITDLAVDASGIYWVNGTTGTVQRCATLTGCGGGEVLATGQTGASRIVLDDKFVYWMTSTTVMKVAK